MKYSNTLLESLSCLSYKIKSRILGIIILLPIISIFITLLYGYDTITQDRVNYETSFNTINENKSMMISYAIEDNTKKAKIQTNETKDRIVDELLVAYNGDTEKMKQDYISMSSNTKFYQIISKNIDHKYLNKENDNNRMFVATKDGVLIDNSLSYVKNSFTAWDEIFSHINNKSLMQNAVISITNKNEGPIIWIDDTNDKTVSYDASLSLLGFVNKCITNGDTKELSKYSVICASYIFDNQDLFGIPDTEVGHMNYNNKIYIIQVFSIKDMIDSDRILSLSLQKYDEALLYQQNNISESSHMKILVIISLVVIELLTFIGIWYLAEFFVYSKFSNDNKSSG